MWKRSKIKITLNYYGPIYPNNNSLTPYKFAKYYAIKGDALNAPLFSVIKQGTLGSDI